MDPYEKHLDDINPLNAEADPDEELRFTDDHPDDIDDEETELE